MTETVAGNRRDCAIVAGGTGFVGGIVVRGLVADGWTVVVTSRSADKLAALRDRADPADSAAEEDGAGRTAGTGRLVPVLLSDDDPAQWRDAVRAAAGPPRAVVAAIGGWRLFPDLLDVPLDAWSGALDRHLTAHLLTLQAFAPLLAESAEADPVYLALNGAAAEQPMADAGPVSITGAGQRMMLDVARVGRLAGRVRFHELSLLAAVRGDDRNVDPIDELHAQQVTDAVRAVLSDPTSGPHLRFHPATR